LVLTSKIHFVFLFFFQMPGRKRSLKLKTSKKKTKRIKASKQDTSGGLPYYDQGRQQDLDTKVGNLE
jgi:hypothetical protein